PARRPRALPDDPPPERGGGPRRPRRRAERGPRARRVLARIRPRGRSGRRGGLGRRAPRRRRRAPLLPRLLTWRNPWLRRGPPPSGPPAALPAAEPVTRCAAAGVFVVAEPPARQTGRRGPALSRRFRRLMHAAALRRYPGTGDPA